MKKMEQRFNHANETETLHVQFNSTRQSLTESTDEWADRLSSFADKAFRDVPEHYVQSQIIKIFLQALTDKAAGKAHPC
jgi:DNA-binding ferritin-like protein